MSEREHLSEEEIQGLIKQLDTPLEAPTTRLYTLEVVTSPYVTFSEDLVGEIVDYLVQEEEVVDPVLLLDLSTGDISAVFGMDASDAEDVVVRGARIFKQAALQAGILLESLTALHCYVAPEIIFEPDMDFEDDEDEEGEGV